MAPSLTDLVSAKDIKGVKSVKDLLGEMPLSDKEVKEQE